MEGVASALERDYDLVGTAGSGSTGCVLRAHRRGDRKAVAIKVIRKDSLTASMKAAIVNEAHVLGSIHSDRVVELFSVLEDDDLKCLVMEYAHGGDLKSVMKMRGAGLSELEALRVLEGVLEGLVHLHANGVAHRDLKLDNIMLGSEGDFGSAKLVDFGLAHCKADPSTDERSATKCGTPQYVAPEIVNGALYEPAQVDMWSLGVVLYALIAGALPFQSASRKELLRMIRQQEVRLDGPAWRDVSAGTLELLRSLLSKEPSLRPDSARCLELVQDAVCEIKSLQTPAEDGGLGGFFGMLLGRFTAVPEHCVTAA